MKYFIVEYFLNRTFESGFYCPNEKHFKFRLIATVQGIHYWAHKKTRRLTLIKYIEITKEEYESIYETF